MLTDVLTPVEQEIAAILGATGGPLSLPQIQKKLVELGSAPVDTFVVRDAVWSLIRKQRADFTPRRLVQAKPAT